MAATGLQLPLNPNPGARVAQYQCSDTLEAVRDQEEEAVVQPVWALANFHNILPVVGDPRNYEDLSNFTVAYLSNQEYFRKLEELKAAHAETMVKLQEMHHNQLPLKEVWPAIIRKDGSRSVWEKNCHYSIMTWLSDPELGWSSSSCIFSSEEDWSNPGKEHPAETRVMPYAKELIHNMWNKFYLRDYMQAEDVHHQAVEKPNRARQKWVPRLTKPEPFQMTIREEKRKDMKANLETVAKLLQKPEEDPECKKKFRATPVPAHILLPLYHKMVKQNEERRRIAKEKNMELLLASQKPFKFIMREEQKRAAREKQLRDLWMSKKKTNRFKARPVPPVVYSSATSHLKRDISTQVGAPKLLHSSSPLPRKATSRRWGNPRFSEQTVLKYKHQVRSQMFDDFEDFQKYPSDPKCPAFRPFDAHTSSKLANREEMWADITTDEADVEETCWSYLSPRRESLVISASTKSTPCHCSLPVPMVSSKAQRKATTRSLKEKKMLEEERNRILAKQRQTVKELEKLLVTQAEDHDSHPRLAQVSKSRITYLKKSGKTSLRQH
ncbi:protein FAM161A-like [Ochotona princeps]|uniref:protein FAM161A-like n=1 Tax=Ochotona princeps TaxID=9978 RepID=UPI0027146C5B|nr:protein FAM161A-like [Ochotona princeps]